MGITSRMPPSCSRAATLGWRTSASAVTDEFGRADFGTIHVDLREGTHTIEILVFKSDYGEKTVEVLVNV